MHARPFRPAVAVLAAASSLPVAFAAHAAPMHTAVLPAATQGSALLVLSQPAATEQAAPTPTSTPTGDAVRRARALERLRRQGKQVFDAAALPEISPALVEAYTADVRALAAEEMAGRLPGTEGAERAADLIAVRFRELGLQPAFDITDTGPDGEQIVVQRSSYRQTFTRGTRAEVEHASLALSDAGPALDAGEDFQVLGFAGSAEFSGPAVFVGYSIVSGPDGYLNYPPDASLDGKAALVLRFEPFDAAGQSKWSNRGWSFNAALQAKLAAAARRGAGAVLLVNPPGADDPRTDTLETIESSSASSPFDIPVLHISAAAADRIIRAGDAQGRGLADLVALANDAPTIVDLPAVRVEATTTIARTDIEMSNVGAILPGRGPLAEEFVVIGAHYDHLGPGHFGSRSPDAAGQIHPGANDNASGTAGVLAAAATLVDGYAALPQDAPARSILFLGFTAEESGLIGSRHYVANPITPADRHTVMLNMDMIGRLRNGRLELGGRDAPRLREVLASSHLDASGLLYDPSLSVGPGRSDHASFESAGIPSLFFFTGLHDEYHTIRDTLDTVHFEGGARIAQLVASVALDAATRPEDLGRLEGRGRASARAETQEDTRRPTVRVGIAPSDAPNDGGVRIDRVFDGTSAAEAGLRAGDTITRWNGSPVSSIDAWFPMLLDHKPGDAVPVTILRDGQMQEHTLTLKGTSESEG